MALANHSVSGGAAADTPAAAPAGLGSEGVFRAPEPPARRRLDYKAQPQASQIEQATPQAYARAPPRK
jgi:hypothetical protein